jgi:hypothetical protein
MKVTRRVNGRSPKAGRTRTAAQITQQEAVPEPGVRLIAFYLPQFHPIAENDEWWGKGFTEWPGVAAAKPLFDGHYQPHIPADLGFYDLRLPESRAAQADLARRYGIHGFCYHYYWFSGRRVLERPLEEVLASGEPDFPFCVCWANEPWSRRWDGSEDELLIAQEHDTETDKKLILELLPFFADRRYIKVDGRPLLVIYRVGLLPDPRALFATWREISRQYGFPDLHICMAETFGLNDPFSYGCDAAVEFPPHQTTAGVINGSLQGTGDVAGNLYHYSDAVLNDIVAPPVDYPRYRCVMPGWDNTPRRGAAGNVFHGATPELFELWLREAIGFTTRHLPPDQHLVFINAWNEWGEGAHLEPDLKYGRAYLEATRRAKAGLSEWRTIMTGARTRFPTAKEDLIALEAWLESFETSLRYLSNQYLSLENTRIGSQPSFMNFSDSQLAALDLRFEGSCNIERINQYVGDDSIDINPEGYLHVVGWNLLSGKEITADTESYLTLIPSDDEEPYTVRVRKRVQRADVAAYYELPSGTGLWSGIRASANLRNVRHGKYEIGIDTKVGATCLRTLSKKVIVVGPS